MQFCIILLAGILAACIKGSLVDNPTMYFKEWWLIAMAGLLCLNLILCSVSRFPVVLKKYKRAEKKKIGAFGSWLTHLGMLFIIVGFAAGQFMSIEYTVYGIPGSIQPVGDSGYWLRIDDFNIDMRDDYTVEQYTASLTMVDENGKEISGEASVNHPMSAFGFELFQDSTGWANYVDIYTNGELKKSDLICAGEYTYPDDRPNLRFYFNKFYPDLSRDSTGNIVTVSPVCNNPHSLFTVYYNNDVMGMNLASMEEAIDVNEYTFVMRDPVQYTLIVLKKDPTELFVGFAALLLLAGIFMAFYYRPIYPAASCETQKTEESPEEESPEELTEQAEKDNKNKLNESSINTSETDDVLQSASDKK